MSQPVSTRPSARADARRNREQILDAAAALLAQDANVTIGEIAAAAGLGRATVYRHFPDVSAIHAAVKEEAREFGKGIVRDRLGADPRPGTCEGSLADTLLQMTRENLPKQGRWGATISHEPLQDEDLIATFTPVVAATFKRGQQRGEFRQDVTADVVAETFVALTFRAARQLQGREQADLETVMQSVEVFLDGLRRRR
ncbi:MAG: TetR/AcrR family transcriptional regulator [Patulibacter minatonensis]